MPAANTNRQPMRPALRLAIVPCALISHMRLRPERRACCRWHDHAAIKKAHSTRIKAAVSIDSGGAVESCGPGQALELWGESSTAAMRPELAIWRESSRGGQVSPRLTLQSNLMDNLWKKIEHEKNFWYM